MTPILLIGGGGHCRSCIDVIEMAGQFSIAGIVQPTAARTEPLLGYATLGTDDDLPDLLHRFPNALITIGQIKSADPRIRLYDFLQQRGAHLPVIVSPLAHISRHAEVMAGTIVMHGSLINAGANVGANVIINSQALVEHDAVIESHCHISTGARVNGGVRIGAGSFIGSGAILREGIRVGANAIIGAGQVVLRDVPAGAKLRTARG